jgi:UDP-glucose 4-epimerase
MILVTGSAGHLGEALLRLLRAQGRAARGLDIKPSPYTDIVGSIVDSETVRAAMAGVTAVLHCATLHKPHVATHSAQDFIDTNVSGTLVLLEEALRRGVEAFVFTSTTSTFGNAMKPERGEPAVWIDEDVMPIPKNIYGATKLAAEHLCEMFASKHRLPTIVLRTSRFFPEDDDQPATRDAFTRDNIQLLERLYRRGDVADMASAHLAALERAGEIGFGRYIVSATSPFGKDDLAELHRNAGAVIRRLYPEADALFGERGWRFLDRIDRVYDNGRARRDLDWMPRYDFKSGLECLGVGQEFRSDLTHEIGMKGYHDEVFAEGPYPVD